MDRPTIGLAMICKDGVARELRRCLSSIAPYVDQIVLVDTGPKGTSGSKVAAEFNAEYYHSTAWWDKKARCIDDFGAARDFAFSFLTTDWLMWIDHDDVLEGGEFLREIVDNAPEEVGGFWMPYFYAFTEQGECTTLHDRERLLRASIGWQWQNRVHETAVPQSTVHWRQEQRVRYIHHGTGSKSNRNFALLFKMYEENPEDLRTWMYIGNQYFADGQYQKAGEWYTRFYRDSRGTWLDRWQSMAYAGRAWREVGNVIAAAEADTSGIKMVPEWADCWYGMAENHIALRQWERAILYAEQGLRMNAPERIIFINPLDYTIRPYNILNVAYAASGMLEEAIKACDMGLQYRPNDEAFMSNRAMYAARQKEMKQVESFASFVDGRAIEDVDRLHNMLSGDVRAMRPVRDIYYPAVLSAAPLGSQPKLHVFCGQTLDEWTPATPDEKGIGGSETAVVEVMSRIQKAGWDVTVFNTTGNAEGYYDGVLYTNWDRWRPQMKSDMFVAWRTPLLGREQSMSKERWLWLHDLNMHDDFTPEIASGFDKVLGVSEFHRDHLKMVYPFIRNVDYVPNGINLERFAKLPERKKRFRCIWASSPDRGLDNLFSMWRVIVGFEPAAELHIFYGWDNLDKMVAMGRVELGDYKRAILKMGKLPGIHWRGKVGQKELAEEMLDADLWLYPTRFIETFAITALEAMAADLKIVTSKAGNIPSLVTEDVGICIPGLASSVIYQDRFIGITMAMMGDLETRAKYAGKGREEVRLWTWENAADRWLKLLGQSTGPSNIVELATARR